MYFQDDQIRNTNIEIRNNIKPLISNDQNISGTYTIFTGYCYVLNLGFMSFVFVSARPGATWLVYYDTIGHIFKLSNFKTEALWKRSGPGISDFELRIFGKSNKRINSIHSTCYLFKWLSPAHIVASFAFHPKIGTISFLATKHPMGVSSLNWGQFYLKNWLRYLSLKPFQKVSNRQVGNSFMYPSFTFLADQRKSGRTWFLGQSIFEAPLLIV